MKTAKTGFVDQTSRLRKEKMHDIWFCGTAFPFWLFCVITYLPKATVQAAIGSVPLAAGLACGKIVLSVAVLAIIITAPLGAIGMDAAYQRLLEKEN